MARAAGALCACVPRVRARGARVSPSLPLPPSLHSSLPLFHPPTLASNLPSFLHSSLPFDLFHTYPFLHTSLLPSPLRLPAPPLPRSLPPTRPSSSVHPLPPPPLSPSLPLAPSLPGPCSLAWIREGRDCLWAGGIENGAGKCVRPSPGAGRARVSGKPPRKPRWLPIWTAAQASRSLLPGLLCLPDVPF